MFTLRVNSTLMQCPELLLPLEKYLATPTVHTDAYIDGRIMLKWILKIRREKVDWILLAQDRIQW